MRLGNRSTAFACAPVLLPIFHMCVCVYEREAAGNSKHLVRPGEALRPDPQRGSGPTVVEQR